LSRDILPLLYSAADKTDTGCDDKSNEVET
jgi:hypothetical protein